MGIRFYCPHCDRRLHVKEFLAGRRGICPHCDEGIMIPNESSIAGEDDEGGEERASATVAPPGTDPAPPRRDAGAGRAGRESVAKGTAGHRSRESNAAAGAAERSDVLGDVAIELVTIGDPNDPVDAAPHLLWYVRPVTGGQYGPADGTTLRRWLGEGRVAADTLVWQEGWDEWREARLVFEGAFGTPPTPPAPKPPAAVREPSRGTSAGRDTYGQDRTIGPLDPAKEKLLDYRLRRSRSQGRQWLAVVLLGLLCVGLVVLLGFVLRQSF